jgi:hypothetical protein
VKVLNYLKKVALFFRFERDILADGAQVIGRDAEKRGERESSKHQKDVSPEFHCFNFDIVCC